VTKNELKTALTDITVEDVVILSNRETISLDFILSTFGDKTYEQMIQTVSGNPINSPNWVTYLQMWHGEDRI